jgi:hypothetical protein
LSDTPFIVSTRFRKVVQTAPYESEEAEVSSQFAIAEGVDAQPAISHAMGMVKGQVYIALGKAEGKLTAVSTAPLATTAAAPSAEPKKGPGRPKKVEEPTQVIPEPPKAEEKPAETKADDDFDFSDDPKPKVEITDQELQGACSDAAKVIGASKVKDLFQKKYGATRVSLVKPLERSAFLADLKSLVAEHNKSSSL